MDIYELNCVWPVIAERVNHTLFSVCPLMIPSALKNHYLDCSPHSLSLLFLLPFPHFLFYCWIIILVQTVKCIILYNFIENNL